MANEEPKPKIHKLFPSFAKITTGRTAHYIVADPVLLEYEYTINNRGRLILAASHSLITASFIISPILFGVIAGVSSGSVAGFVSGMLLGAVLGLPVIFPVLTLAKWAKNKITGQNPNAYLKAAGQGGITKRVESRHLHAWRICNTAEQLARTRSWSNHVVDQQRRTPNLLWNAVVRSLSSAT